LLLPAQVRLLQLNAPTVRIPLVLLP